MKYCFEVGVSEKHSVEFNYSKMTGGTKILIDGKIADKSMKPITFDLDEVYEYKIGEKEINKVKIERRRKLFGAVLRKDDYKIYVNDELIDSFKAY